jgi:hypothetical protein
MRNSITIVLVLVVVSMSFVTGCKKSNSPGESGKEAGVDGVLTPTASATETEQYVYATVIDESGTLVAFQGIIEHLKDANATPGNYHSCCGSKNCSDLNILQSINLNYLSYIIKFRTGDEKVYTMKVLRDCSEDLEVLAVAIEKGTAIRIKKSNLDKYPRLFGSIWISEIELLSEQK